nr:hypothetical protein CFP56_04834 [Quercus suber]
MEGPQAGEGFIARNCNRASSRGQRSLESERRREQQHMQDGHETRIDSDEWSSQGDRSVSYIPKRSRRVIAKGS